MHLFPTYIEKLLDNNKLVTRKTKVVVMLNENKEPNTKNKKENKISMVQNF